MKKQMLAAALAAMAVMAAALPACAGETILAGAGSEAEAGVQGAGTAGNIIALDDLNISVAADQYAAVSQDDGFVYIYTMTEGSMPYVIIGAYDMDSAGFADKFTNYMAGEYADLDVNSLEEGVNVNGLLFDRVTYAYTVSNYTVEDTRMFTGMNGRTYMFGMKEIPELGYTIGREYLEGVAGSMAGLAGGYGDYTYHVDAQTSLGPDGAAAGSQSAGLVGSSLVDGTVVEGAAEAAQGTDAAEAADGAGTLPYSEIQFTESMAGFEGIWCPFEDGFQLYLPSDWVTFQVPDDQKMQGCLYQAGPESALTDGTAPHIAVNYMYIAEYDFATIEDLANDLTASGYTVEGIANINGIDCVLYHMDEMDLHGIMFYGPDDPEYVFAVAAYQYGNNENTLAPVLCSLSEYVG